MAIGNNYATLSRVLKELLKEFKCKIRKVHSYEYVSKLIETFMNNTCY